MQTASIKRYSLFLELVYGSRFQLNDHSSGFSTLPKHGIVLISYNSESLTSNPIHPLNNGAHKVWRTAAINEELIHKAELKSASAPIARACNAEKRCHDFPPSCYSPAYATSLIRAVGLRTPLSMQSVPWCKLPKSSIPQALRC